MPRARHKAKGPKPTKDWREQANRMLGKRFLDLGSRHAAKQAAGLKGNASTGFIHSIATLRKHEFALKKAGEWLEQTFGVTRLDMISKEQAVAYLAHRQGKVGQKQLDADRLALQFCRKVGDLARIKTDRIETKSGRAYTPGQVARIAERQSEHNGLATRIAYNAGLRAHELKTLRPIDQGKPSAHREWRPDRFLGRTGTRYLVVGKEEGWSERCCSLRPSPGPWRRDAWTPLFRQRIVASTTRRITISAAEPPGRSRSVLSHAGNWAGARALMVFGTPMRRSVFGSFRGKAIPIPWPSWCCRRSSVISGKTWSTAIFADRKRYEARRPFPALTRPAARPTRGW